VLLVREDDRVVCNVYQGILNRPMIHFLLYNNSVNCLWPVGRQWDQLLFRLHDGWNEHPLSRVVAMQL
jgi:hypothetical protein